MMLLRYLICRIPICSSFGRLFVKHPKGRFAGAVLINRDLFRATIFFKCLSKKGFCRPSIPLPAPRKNKPYDLACRRLYKDRPSLVRKKHFLLTVGTDFTVSYPLERLAFEKNSCLDRFGYGPLERQGAWYDSIIFQTP